MYAFTTKNHYEQYKANYMPIVHYLTQYIVYINIIIY